MFSQAMLTGPKEFLLGQDSNLTGHMTNHVLLKRKLLTNDSLLASITGDIFLRFSGERRQAQSKRKAREELRLDPRRSLYACLHCP